MFAEDHSRRACVAAAILAVHAAGLYAALTFAQQIHQVSLPASLAVTFVTNAERPPPRQLPQVAVVMSQPTLQQPQLPIIEIPNEAPAPNAITIAATPPPPASAPPEERGAPKLISTVEYVREPSPRYPPQSRRLREQGLVVLRVLIDERGSASSIEIETSSGHARLDAAARDAVTRAEFRPYVEDGEPRRALVLIPIEFALNRSAA